MNPAFKYVLVGLLKLILYEILQINFIVLHVIKGAPWEIQDQGLARRLTHWEQIDYGVQFTRTRKFLTIVPIIL